MTGKEYETRYIVFIVEGQIREVQIFNRVKNDFFNDRHFDILTLSVDGSIYSLWKKLESDEFQTDVIEVLRETGPEKVKQKLKDVNREQISDIFLFFDYDVQCEHGDVYKADRKISELLNYFTDSTETGKLYISFPSIESFWDWVPGTCNTGTECVISFEDIRNYKTLSRDKNEFNHLSQYSHEIWNSFLNNYLMRTGCLFELGEMPTFSVYRDEINPIGIYDRQMDGFLKFGRVFVLSAIPEFLLEYFNEGFWSERVINADIDRGSCNRTVSWSR